MQRCLNNIWGYCSGEPEAEEGKEIKSGDLTVIEKKCRLDPKTCGKYQKFSEQIDASKLPELSGSYKHTVVAVTPERKASKSSKDKKKAVAKQEERLL